MVELLGARCLMSLLRSPGPGRTRKVPLAQKLAIEQESLANLETQLDVEALRTGLYLGESRDQQLRFISNAAHGCSWYYRISKVRTSYFNKVRKEEVPFVRVWELVESITRRRHGIDEQSSVDGKVSQTTFHTMANALLL